MTAGPPPPPPEAPAKPSELELLSPRAASPTVRLRVGLRQLGGLFGEVAMASLRAAAILFALGMAYLCVVTLQQGFEELVAALLLWSEAFGNPPELLVLFGPVLVVVGVKGGKLLLFAACGVLGLDVGWNDVLLPSWTAGSGDLVVSGGVAEPTTLHGRPGLALTIFLFGGQQGVGSLLEVVVRLRGPEGALRRATLEAFADPSGAFRVRRSLAMQPGEDPEAGGVPPAQVVVFLPLLALERTSVGDGAQPLVAEALVFVDGVFRGEGEVALTLDPSDPRYQGLLEGPADPAVALGDVELLEGAGDPREVFCSVCGDALDEAHDVLVHCDRCLIPHHEECWRFFGSCSTYACAGHPRPGPAAPDEVAAPPLPVPLEGGAPALLAGVRRVTDVPPFPVPVGYEGPVPDGVRVPRAPRSLWEYPLVVVLYTAGLYLLPVALGGALLWTMPWGFAAVALLMISVSAASPMVLPELALLPVNLAGPALARAFPVRGLRDLSHFVHLLRVDAGPAAAEEGGGVEVRGKLLQRGMPGHRLELALRLRGPGGEYLKAADGAFQGRFEELCGVHRCEPASGPEVSALEFRLRVPAAAVAAALPRVLPVSAEVLVACDGEVLSEADVAGHLARGGAGAPVPAGPWARDRPVPRPSDAELRPPDNARCGVCGDPPSGKQVRCDQCGHRHHIGCGDFRGLCARCDAPALL